MAAGPVHAAASGDTVVDSGMGRRRQREASGLAVPLVLAAALALAYGPALLRASLLQGDLPGHLEAARQYARSIWPLPWGWDPRYLGGAPLGVLYPPLLSWTVGGLGKWVGVENALRWVLLAAIVGLPPSMYAAARGLGLRRGPAGFAAALGLAVLWLPWRGLGGSLHQTLMAGNAANALALPLLGVFLWRLRRSVARSARWYGAALVLAGLLLCHFLVGAVAGLQLGAFAVWRALRVRSARPFGRGLLIAGFGLGLAAPFIVPFLFHLPDASPDAIAFSPFPHAIEWLALAGLACAILLHPRWTGHPMLPMLVLAVVLYACRGIVFPVLGTPPFRMEYHRFRLFVYLANVPAWWLLVQSRTALRGASRVLATATVVLLGALFLFVRYDARGPAPVPLPAWRNDGHRLLVLATPPTQHGSWHGLQTRSANVLDTPVVKGLFVESSPLARRVFELEWLASRPESSPMRWAIRTASDQALADLDDRALARRFADLAVDRVLAREPVSDRLASLATARVPLGPGYTLWMLPTASWAWRGDDRSPLAATLGNGGTRIVVGLEAPGAAVISVNGFPDWRVTEGSAESGRTADGLLTVHGVGVVTLEVAPRSEEWAGLAAGAVAAALLVGLAARRKRR